MTTERDVLDRLNVRYGKTLTNGGTTWNRYTRAEHVRLALGWAEVGFRTADYIAVDMSGTMYGPEENRGPYLHGHEVKVSRSDWLTELKDPTKAAAFSVYMHYWWLVVSDPKIVREGELPEGWGLMAMFGSSLRVVVQAPKQIPVPMSLNQFGALLRATAKTSTRIEALRFEKLTVGL